jgi:hypothetical protein
MCLQLPHSDKPHNRSNVRWKVLVVRNGKIVSPYKDARWNVGTFKRARIAHKYDIGAITRKSPNFGIHVFTTKKDAIKFSIQINTCEQVLIAKLIVSRFNQAGYYAVPTPVNGGYLWVKVKNETWKTAQLVELYSPDGRRIVTENYIYS